MLLEKHIARLFILGLCAAASAALPATVNAQTGYQPVYNVKSAPYNATGNGTTNDAPAVEAAINAAIATGGIVYFPEGIYVIGNSIPSTAAAFDLSKVTLRGAAVGVTDLQIGSTFYFTVTSSGGGSGALHGGTIENMEIECPSPQGTTPNVGLVMQDSVGLKIRNVSFVRCPTGVSMQNVHGSTLGNDFDDVSFFDDRTAVRFDQSIAIGSSNHYYYNHFRTWINNVLTGSRGFYTVGGADASNNTFTVIGNVNPGTTIFDIHTAVDSKLNSFTANSYTVKLEPGSADPDTSYLFDGHADAGTAPTITGVAQFEDGCCNLATTGTTNLFLTTLDAYGGPITYVPAPFDHSVASDISPLTQLTIASGTSSGTTILSPRIKDAVYGGSCFITGDNAAGAALAATANVAATNGKATISFVTPPASTAYVRLWCTQ